MNGRAFTETRSSPASTASASSRRWSAITRSAARVLHPQKDGSHLSIAASRSPRGNHSSTDHGHAASRRAGRERRVSPRCESARTNRRPLDPFVLFLRSRAQNLSEAGGCFTPDEIEAKVRELLDSEGKALTKRAQ